MKYEFLLQIVLLSVPVKGVTVLVMRRPPQKLLRSDIPATFFAPGICRQSNPTEREAIPTLLVA